MRRFTSVLPGRLRADYGHGGPYTPMQVEATIRRHRIAAPEYAVYALGLFCDGPALSKQLGAAEAARVRRELGDGYFGGSPGFSYNDVRSLCSEGSSDYGGDSCGADFSGSGAGAGDGGGGGGD
jgi:hypothetical protein